MKPIFMVLRIRDEIDEKQIIELLRPHIANGIRMIDTAPEVREYPEAYLLRVEK